MAGDGVSVLVLNPNSSESMTRDIESACKHVLVAPDIRLEFTTAPSDAPPSINGIADGVLSSAAVLKSPAFARIHADAVVVACFSPHPLVPIFNEAFPDTVVVGIYEAAVQTAVQLGSFGIVTTGAQWEPILYNHLETSAGICKERCVGVRGTGVAVLDLDHGDTTRTALLNSSLELLRAGAEIIVLGCAGMASLVQQLQDDLLSAEPWRPGLRNQYVPVIDGVRAAIEIAANLVRMKRRPVLW